MQTALNWCYRCVHYRNELLVGRSTANTARVHGCSVHTTRVHGRVGKTHGRVGKKALHDNAFSTRADTAPVHTPVLTGREHGPWTRPVNTGSVYRPLVKRFRFKIHALCKKIIYIRSFFSTFKAIAIPIRIPPCSHGSQIQSNQIHRTCYGARRTTSAVGRQTTVTREDQNVEKRWALSLDKNNVKK